MKIPVMRVLIIIATVILNIPFGIGQNKVSFITYKSINKGYIEELSEFNNEYDSEYKFIFYPKRIEVIDLRGKKLSEGLEDLVKPGSYTSIHYIENVTLTESGSLLIEIYSNRPDSTTHFYEIYSNKLDHLVYKTGKLIYKNTGLFKRSIVNPIFDYYLTYYVLSQKYHAYEQSVQLKNSYGKYELPLNWKKCDKVINIFSEKVTIKNNANGNSENLFVKEKEKDLIKRYEENFILHCKSCDNETVKIMISRDGSFVGISVQYEEKLIIYKVNQVFY
ncbi:MAG: hypothetical protein H8E98_05925 [Bacteroidetes bacterium]|nr:hypothetical protein [Bacteroidota bacterium]